METFRSPLALLLAPLIAVSLLGAIGRLTWWRALAAAVGTAVAWFVVARPMFDVVVPLGAPLPAGDSTRMLVAIAVGVCVAYGIVVASIGMAIQALVRRWRASPPTADPPAA